MEITNSYVTDFYTRNAFIDFEKVNVCLVDLLKCCMDTNESEGEKEVKCDFKMDYPCIPNLSKGATGEKQIEMILNKLNPSEEIIQNTDETIFGDFIILGKNRPNIIVENKVSETNIKPGEIESFIQTCKKHKCNGVLMSQHTGITGKNNFEMDIIDSNVIIYIHKVEYDENKILLAFEIMNKLYNKIKLMNLDNNSTIPKEVLYEINKEYQLFVTQKEEIQKFVKNNQVQMLSQIENIKLTNLTNYLSTHFANIEKKGIHKCNLCNFYTSNTLKGMAAHKRGCKKKYPGQS
jgi:hypothetical protein